MAEVMPPESSDHSLHIQHSRYGLALRALARFLALFGGMVFVALVVMSIVSITGRKIASMPVPGDVELLQMCAAFASASFLAWCHLNQGDVKVDFFTQKWPSSITLKLDALGSLLVGLFGLLIGWRCAAAAMVAMEFGETSPILGLPLWLAQLLMVPGFVVLGLSGLYMAAVLLKGSQS